ncbi:hypothetical protein [Shewanella sp.]|uniref:hypothetical protein n=1 Tax=Shewanella sp. TaxID=50422 RepID=UPI00356497D8
MALLFGARRSVAVCSFALSPTKKQTSQLEADFKLAPEVGAIQSTAKKSPEKWFSGEASVSKGLMVIDLIHVHMIS